MLRSETLRKMGRAILLPWHALRIVSGAKEFRSNPVLGSEVLNRRGLHIWRVKTAAQIVAWRRSRLKHLLPEDQRRFFAANGYIERRNLLPFREFEKLRGEVEALSAPAREMIEGHAVTRRIPLTPDILDKSPAIRSLLENPAWRDPIRYVGGFKIEPVLSIQTVFTTKDAGDPQTDLHMDTFHSTVKAWFFLYDVAEDEGPFTYVAGSHRLTKRRLAWQKRRSVVASRGAIGGSFRISSAEIRRLRLPDPTSCAVPANTLVVGDTFGFHARGRSARPSMRIELYASQRPNPFMPFLGLDTAHFPFVSRRKEIIGWFLEDILFRLGLRRQIWRPVGLKRPADGFGGTAADGEALRSKMAQEHNVAETLRS